MEMKLPHNGFRWLTGDELDRLDICGFDINGDYGLILEVFDMHILLLIQQLNH